MQLAKRLVCSVLAAVTVLAFGLLFSSSSAGETRTIGDRKAQRIVGQSRLDQIKRHTLNLDNLRSRYVNDIPATSAFGSSIIHDSPRSGPSHLSSAIVPPPPSPGIVLGLTSYDYQANDSPGHQVARMPGADIVHFVWMHWDRLPSAGVDYTDRFVAYNSYRISDGVVIQGFDGTNINLGDGARAGYPACDVWDDNSAQVVLHQREDVSLPYNPWHLAFPTPGSPLHINSGLGGYGSGGCPEVLWPKVAASRDGSRTSHVLAHSNTNDCPLDLLWYWRYDGTNWTGPVIIDSTPQISYTIADDPTGDKLAVAVHVSNWSSMNGINNVAYLESTTDGAGWIAGSETKTKNVITNYDTDAGPGAFLHLAPAYDHSGILHIVWDEQEDANDNALTAIKHWNSQRQTIRTVALAYWETPLLTGVFNLNLAKISMGIGDGSTLCQGGAESNEDYLYVLYTRFGGPTPEEQADASAGGYYNGELYLSASTTGGNSWSAPVNLTNTKTPDCNPGVSDTTGGLPQRSDSVCRSEHWATIGLAVSDIDIFFISDLDAGGIPQGEGTWQLNPVHYYRIPGGTTDAQHLCPLISANFEASITSRLPECEYNATQAGQNVETLTIMNLGNADLSGDLSVTDFPGVPTLSVSAPGPYTIVAGDPDLVKTVTMASSGATEGLYSGAITITHNDPSELSPRVFPIDFFVFNDFFCPQDSPGFVTGATTTGGLGSLSLQVESNGRFASQYPEGGLWRRSDSSSSILDASLLVAHGPQGPDTTVYLRFYDRLTNGQFGFRALSDMTLDASAYGTGEGCAIASARMCTADSVVGISVDWYAPQDYAFDEFVFAEYRFYRHQPSIPVEDLALGILVDADVLPSAWFGGIQNAATNTPGSDVTRNLIWQQGVDTACFCIPIGNATATRFRGGIAVPGGFAGALVGNAKEDLIPGGGPTDGFLYNTLSNISGVDLFSDSATDLFMLVALDRNRSIAVGETLSYTVIFLSDTISEASLKRTADSALANFTTLCATCTCPCWADPQCDGVRSDVQDVIAIINSAFRGVAPIFDPGCSFARSDVDANGTSDVIDVVKVVSVAFRGQTAAANYVDPCL